MKHKLTLLPLLALFPLAAQAHVQWFVKPEEMKDVALPLDATSIWLSAGVLACVLAAILLTRYSGVFSITGKLVSRIPPVDHRLYLVYFMALIDTFLVMILLQGGFLAPNLILPVSLLPVGVFLQAVIVVCSSFSMALAGVAVLFTTGVVLSVFTPISVNYVFELGAIGIFMILNGPVISRADQWALSADKAEQRWKLSVRILRIGIGLQLVVLALTEKLINPGLGLVFVEMYPFYNFFPALGLEQVSNLHFVYFIGIAELALGGMLALGIACRIVLAALAVAFTTTAIIHGLHEILGHLPIFAAAVILLLECVNEPAKAAKAEARETKNRTRERSETRERSGTREKNIRAVRKTKRPATRKKRPAVQTDPQYTTIVNEHTDQPRARHG
ncbi:MAG: hypothetical protein LBE06_12990 [Azoarcus sp.]|jgi:hypothetical protein|nr:hypothetical protein [Azoarcus sp.]